MPNADEKKHELQRVGAKIVDDISSGAKAAAEKMLGASGGPGGMQQTNAEFLDYVRRNATQPEPMGSQWRTAFLEQQIVAIENPYAQADDGSDAYIPARNGVAHVEAILADAFPFGNPASPPMPPPPLPEPVAPVLPAPAPAPPVPGAAGEYDAMLSQIPDVALLNYLASRQPPQGAPQEMMA